MKLSDEMHSLYNGNEFYKCDLHVHTLASLHYKEKDATPEKIVKSALEKGLKVIAITDHNTSKWCEPIIEAAKDTGLCVLPGVEISCLDGCKDVHIIAIFPPKNVRNIQDLLSQIGIKAEEQQNPTEETISTKDIIDVLDSIKNLGFCAFAIAPHADDNNGIAYENQGVPRKDIIEHPVLLAIETKKDSARKYLHGIDSDYKRKLACIQSSDSHSLDEIGSTFTYIKMDITDFEGLRQALLDPDSRIRDEINENEVL